MANTKSAKKRARQAPRRKDRNASIRSAVRSAVRGAREAISTKDKNISGMLKDAISALSKAANKGTIHKRNAARRISRLAKAAASGK
jgi:small subunit ribosomal protein S20